MKSRRIALVMLWLCLGLLHNCTTPAPPVSNPAIVKAMESVQEVVPRAEADPTRPVYHFLPPAQWMNDPNGTYYHAGYYHVFYQHNPYGDQWGHMHWGHTRSRDLVHWEHLPIALWPSKELGEDHCFSGCAGINPAGEPMIFYTKVGDKRPNEQWAALGDRDFMTWTKHPRNPILALETHGGPAFLSPWRDPFIFHVEKRTFMVLGADTEKTAAIPIYEAMDDAWTQWAYRGNLYELPKKEMPFFECPNFFKVDDTWVLLTSPYTPVQFYSGTFDLSRYAFTPEAHVPLNYSPNYYATNICYDDKGRCILHAWIRGFDSGRGWNGCLALPRTLHVSEEGLPIQVPVPELKKLRGRHFRQPAATLSGTPLTLDSARGDTLELIATFGEGDAKAYGLQLRCSDSNDDAITLSYDKNTVTVDSVAVPIGDSEKLTLHVYLDKSVLEVFINEGRYCVSKAIKARPGNMDVRVFAEGGQVSLQSLEGWHIKSIW